MSLLEAIILGIIQGLTEFLPVSSSGHLELGTYILGIEAADNLLFAVIVHAATALSTIVVFRKDIWVIIQDLFKFQWNEGTQFVAKIFITLIPIGIVGVFFEDYIDEFFGGQIIFVGSMLLVTAALLSISYYVGKKEGKITFGKAFIIGIAQTIAVLPGISRSGSTIATALILGVEKERATRFSFLMVLIPILGASFLKTLKYFKDPSIAEGISAVALGAGFVAAFIAGLFACMWMIEIVKRGKLIYFAIYCAIVGMIAIAAGILI